MKQKILIYGVGPFGSLFAERLIKAGHHVFLVDQGQRQQDLKDYGIVIENAVTGEQTITQAPVVEQLDPEDVYDLVIISMRKNWIADVLPILSANKKVPTFLFMMNNAAGQSELVSALGKERVMIGFPLPGGFLDERIVRMLPVDEKRPMTLPIGETDGRVTARTKEVANVLGTMRGYRIDIRTDMDAWLKTHVALLVPSLVPAIYACNLDAEWFAKTRDARVLGIRALREALSALESVGVSISPPNLKAIKYIPEPLFVFMLGKFSKSLTFQNALGDLKTKPDEIKHLAAEFFNLIEPVPIELPAMDQLSAYLFSHKKPMPPGQKDIPLDYKTLWGAGAVALLAAYAVYKTINKRS